jgi:hypothetical protein
MLIRNGFGLPDTPAEVVRELDRASTETRLRFHRAFNQHSTDPMLAALADYAFWLVVADAERGAGRAEAAALASASANHIYHDVLKLGDRGT